MPTKKSEVAKRRAKASNEWRKRNPEKHAANNAAFRKRTQEQVAGRKKPKRCDVCKKVAVLHFDHCHKGGHFRGWLCFGCNAALGAAKDSPRILRRLADYLDADRARDKCGLPKLPTYLGKSRRKNGNDKI